MKIHLPKKCWTTNCIHESFREYLVKEKAKQVNDASERILNFCASWQALEGIWEQRYTLEHYALHLSESKKESSAIELRQLLQNIHYISTQQKVLKKFDASRDSCPHWAIKGIGMEGL